MRRPVSRSVRLVLEGMEHRLVPANSLEIVSPIDNSANVTATDDGLGTITISATGASAKLKITDIETAMKTAGVTRVIVTTADPSAPDGGQAGDIVWAVSTTGDLNFAGFGANKTLAFRAAGDIELTDLHFVLGDANNHSSLEFDTSAGNGDVKFKAGATHGVVFDELAVSNLTVIAGSGDIRYENTPTPAGFNYARVLGNITLSGATVSLANDDGLVAGNDIAITASSLELGGSIAADGDITLNGPITLNRDVAIGRVPGDPKGASSSVTLAGTVEGTHLLSLNASNIAIQQSIGAIANLTGLKIDGGEVAYGANPISAATITIGDGFLGSSTPLVSFAGTGTLTGDVVVKQDATIAPGGLGVGGTLPIVGNLNFVGGVLDIDLGSPNDLVHVTGNVPGNVTGNVTLSTSSSFLNVHGFIPSIADVQIVGFTGSLTGSFRNVPVVNRSQILTESDVLTVSHYGPAGTGITLAPLAIDFNAVGGSEYDGTGYVARLIGPGVLGAVLDGAGVLSLATHGTTTASRIIVTTTANASDDIVHIANVSIHGSLGALIAPKVDARVHVDGTIASINLHDVQGLTIGGTNRTSLVAATISGAVATSGALSSIRVAGSITGNIDATTIGTLRAQSVDGDITASGAIASIGTTAGFTGDLAASSLGSAAIGTVLGRQGAAVGDPRPTWTIGDRFGTLTASGISHFALNAVSMGTLNVVAKLKIGLGGHMTDTLVTLSGNSGVSTGRLAIKTVRVAGAITDSLLDIEDGNVDSVTVGRFVRSRLYLGYDPNGVFNTGGLFDANRLGKVNRFSTTAMPLGQDFNPSNFAFVGSEVAANTFGKVLLSGLETDNNNIAFGFKYHTTPGSIRVAAGLPTNLLGISLDPAQSPYDDFFLVAG